MKENKSRDAFFMIVMLIVIGGIVLLIYGLILLAEAGSYGGLLVSANGITYVVTGVASILSGVIIGILGDVFYDTRDATVKQLRIVQKIDDFQFPEKQLEDKREESEKEEFFTLDWTRHVVKEWPLQVAKFQAFNESGSFWGRVELKNLAQKEIEYLEFEVEFWDYLKRKVEQEDKLIIRELVTLSPNESVWSSLFLLPHLISDAQVNLIGVRYADGEVELMPREVERYSLPVVTPFDGSQSFINFTSSYLEGRGFDVMPTYYYDSTPTHWNCVFCGTINEQKDNSCASCKRERQIQHFAREEFLWKKFEESSST